MTHLETQRLYFRAWKKSDFSVFVDFYSDEKNARFVGGVKSPEEAWRLMSTYLGHYELMGYSYLATVEKESDKVIGTLGLWNSDPWPEPELGYWLIPEFQGKGYGAEAGVVVRDFARNELKLPSLVSYIDKINQPSITLAERLGATRDSTIELLAFGPHEVYRYW